MLGDNKIIDSIKSYCAKRLLRKITHNKKINSILDFSTGNSKSAVVLQKLFPQASIVATDFQDEAPPLIKENKSIKYLKIFNALDPISGKYDFIVLRHVLEHNYYPVELLKNLSKNLTEDGFIYIEVPNLHSGCAKIFKKFPIYHAPYHVFHFTEKSLAMILEKSGLKYKISKAEMPVMGNFIAKIIGCNSNFIIKIIGIFLHPLQKLIEFIYKSSTCLLVEAKK